MKMKRSRAPNFNNSEIKHLLRLVEKYFVIENKKSDGATVRLKQAAWQKLTTEYNEQTKYCQRSAENLHYCYKNQKIRSRMKLNRDENDKDDEPQPSSSGDAMMVQGRSSADGHDSPFEGDEATTEQQPSVSIDVEILDRDESVSFGRKTPQIRNTGDKHNKSNGTDYDDAINKAKKKLVSKSFQELADDKRELVKAQKELIRYQIDHEKLQIEIAKQKLDYEKRRNELEYKFLQEKYKMELNLLSKSKSD